MRFPLRKKVKMNNNDAMNGILYIVGHIPVSKRVTISTYLSGEFVALFTIITKAIFRCKRRDCAIECVLEEYALYVNCTLYVHARNTRLYTPYAFTVECFGESLL